MTLQSQAYKFLPASANEVWQMHQLFYIFSFTEATHKVWKQLQINTKISMHGNQPGSHIIYL